MQIRILNEILAYIVVIFPGVLYTTFFCLFFKRLIFLKEFTQFDDKEDTRTFIIKKFLLLVYAAIDIFTGVNFLLDYL